MSSEQGEEERKNWNKLQWLRQQHFVSNFMCVFYSKQKINGRHHPEQHEEKKTNEIYWIKKQECQRMLQSVAIDRKQMWIFYFSQWCPAIKWGKKITFLTMLDRKWKQ